MKRIAINFLKFLQNPQEIFEEALSRNQKWNLFFTILLIDFVFVLISGGFIAILDEYILKLETDNIDHLFRNDSALFILFIAAILIPFIEEFIFRLYLNYKRNFLFLGLDRLTKNRTHKFWIKHFKWFLYLSAVLFGLVHATNYSNNSLIFYLFIPLIVLPQFLGGITLGYIRLRLGFFWSVLQHGLYNFIIFLGAIFFFNTSTLVNHNSTDYVLHIEQLEFGLNKPSGIKRHQSALIVDSIIATNYPIKLLAEVLNSKDSVLLKNSDRINFRFINKSGLENPNSLILTKLENGINSEK